MRPVELGKLPKIDKVVEAPELDESRALVGRKALVAIARDVLAHFRTRVRAGGTAPALSEVVEAVRVAALRRRETAPRRVVNATGVLLHTNLGRAPLPALSLERIAAVASGYSSLEYDVETGERSRRGVSVESSLATLTGAASALVVNNNAAAVLLALTAVARGREVVVSRGELVEIGGGFRIPEVLDRSNATMVEVGTTNRTRVEDYERALTPQTACILRVHPSNFVISGFTERPHLAALADLSRRRGVPLIEDLGGGLVVESFDDAFASSLGHEPTVQASVRAGVDLTCFSLDKLFGGPQGGAIVGGASLVDRLRKDPLARALRVDKLTLAALDGVLDAYARRDHDAIPVLRQLRATPAALEDRVEGWRAALGERAERTSRVVTASETGGGTLSGGIPSVALAVKVPSPDEFTRRLREHEPPVIARIENGDVILDPRTVLPGEDEEVVGALQAALESFDGDE